MACSHFPAGLLCRRVAAVRAEVRRCETRQHLCRRCWRAFRVGCPQCKCCCDWRWLPSFTLVLMALRVLHCYCTPIDMVRSPAVVLSQFSPSLRSVRSLGMFGGRVVKCSGWMLVRLGVFAVCGPDRLRWRYSELQCNGTEQNGPYMNALSDYIILSIIVYIAFPVICASSTHSLISRSHCASRTDTKQKRHTTHPKTHTD